MSQQQVNQKTVENNEELSMEVLDSINGGVVGRGGLSRPFITGDRLVGRLVFNRGRFVGILSGGRSLS